MIPGHKTWQDWIAEGWKSWKIHAKINNILRAENLHPFMLAANWIQGFWPDTKTWVSIAVDPVRTALFGEESHMEAHDTTTAPDDAHTHPAQLD